MKIPETGNDSFRFKASAAGGKTKKEIVQHLTRPPTRVDMSHHDPGPLLDENPAANLSRNRQVVVQQPSNCLFAQARLGRREGAAAVMGRPRDADRLFHVHGVPRARKNILRLEDAHGFEDRVMLG